MRSTKKGEKKCSFISSVVPTQLNALDVLNSVPAEEAGLHVSSA